MYMITNTLLLSQTWWCRIKNWSSATERPVEPHTWSPQFYPWKRCMIDWTSTSQSSFSREMFFIHPHRDTERQRGKKKTIIQAFVLQPHGKIVNRSKRHCEQQTKERSTYDIWTWTISTWKLFDQLLFFCRKWSGTNLMDFTSPENEENKTHAGHLSTLGWKHLKWMWGSVQEEVQVRW